MQRMERELVTLKNGLDCIFIQAPERTAASIQMWFRAGSALERGQDQGIAHFLEHMFFKGTKKRPRTALVREVESLGGEINAFTSFDYTCYYINIPNDSLKNAVEILLDMVSNPVFHNEDINPEREVVFEEYRRSLDSPNQFAFHKIQNSCFTQGYAHPILGEEKTIKHFSKRQLVKFRRMFYNRQNAFLVVAGNITKKTGLTKAVSSFQLPRGAESRFPEFVLKTRPMLDVHQKEVGMASLSLCIQAPAFTHPKAPAEDLALNCLGHGESSSLYRELISKAPLANSLSSSTMFMNSGGLHFIKILFPPPMLDGLLKQLEKILKKTFQQGFSEKELQKIKNQYMASKMFNLESLESYAFSIGYSYAQTKTLNSDDEFIERVKLTDIGAVHSAFKKIFGRPIHLSLQIPPKAPLQKAKKSLLSFQHHLAKTMKQKMIPEKSYKIQTSRHDSNLKLIQMIPGIQLLYKQCRLSPTFVLQAYLQGGKTEEDTANSGLYNLFSSMITKGHRNATYEKLKISLEEKAASFSSFSGKNNYGLSLHGLSEHFQNLATHFFDSLLYPSFNNKVFQTHKKLILRKIESDKENPQRRLFVEALKLFFDGHPYSLAPIGTTQSLKSLKREDLLRLHSKDREQKEILFVYCGDINLEEILSSFKKTLTELKPRERQKLFSKKINQIVTTSFVPFNREQTQIFTGIKTLKSSSREHLYLKFLTTYLSGQSSPLFVEVRDRLGLCYSVAPIHHSALEGGYWGIYMASGHDKTLEALHAIRKILQNIKQNGLTKKDFKTIKSMIKGQNLINIQTNEDYANVHSHSILQGRGLDYFHQQNQLIDGLQYTAFQQFVPKLLNRKWSTILVGRETGAV